MQIAGVWHSSSSNPERNLPTLPHISASSVPKGHWQRSPSCPDTLTADPPSQPERLQVIHAVQQEFEAADIAWFHSVGEPASDELEAAVDRIAIHQADTVVVSVPNDSSVNVNLSLRQWSWLVDAIEEDMANNKDRAVSQETRALIAVLKLVPGTISLRYVDAKCPPTDTANTNFLHNISLATLVGQESLENIQGKPSEAIGPLPRGLIWVKLLEKAKLVDYDDFDVKPVVVSMDVNQLANLSDRLWASRPNPSGSVTGSGVLKVSMF